MEDITLLDGVNWRKDVLVERMEDDDFYYGYCDQNMFSSSKVKNMARSPKSYYFINKGSSQALRDGTLFHHAILEPEKFSSHIYSKTKTKTTKEYKELKDKHYPTPVYTQTEKQDAERLAQAYLLNDTAMRRVRNSKTEVANVGIISGIPFRAKADIVTDTGVIVDLKTCQNITNFRKDAYNLGYDIQLYIYTEVFGIKYDKFEFIAIDKKSLDIGIYKCSKEFYESGKMKTLNVLTAYKSNIQDKHPEEVKEFINNYYFEDTL